MAELCLVIYAMMPETVKTYTVAKDSPHFNLLKRANGGRVNYNEFGDAEQAITEIEEQGVLEKLDAVPVEQLPELSVCGAIYMEFWL